MKIEIIASGSTGNCYKISNENTALIIECGISPANIRKSLKFQLHEIDACFITHEHLDHAKAVVYLMKSGIDCYATQGTIDALQIKGHRTIPLKKNKDAYYPVLINDMYVIPFCTVHDALEPVGFLIIDGSTDEVLAFITDTAYVEYKFPKLDYLMCECNYVKSTLDNNVLEGRLNINLRNRIVRNHMGLETVLELLKSNDLRHLKAVYVLHLSDSNSDEQLIVEEIKRATGVPVYVG